jgi:4-amino-4-deoxy-L-arabinose transferase-like glycosyltransferase
VFRRKEIALKAAGRSWADVLSGVTWREVAAGVILVGLLVSFLASGWEEILANWNSRDTDQSAYMEIGLDIRRGIALTDGNRHPLYPSMLALFAEYGWAYFTTAKLLNLAIAGLALCTAYWVVAKVSGIHAALVTVVLVSHAHRFLDSAGKVVVEPLLMVIVLLTWFLIWEGKGVATWCGLAGLGAGLAYLAKGTGQIILIAFLASSVLVYRKEVLRKRGTWLFLGGYAVLSAGLWLYNTLNYGNPFYNLPTTHYMWLDSWEDSYLSGSDPLPTMATYLQSHSVQQMVRRLSKGLVLVLKPIRQTWVPLWDIVLPMLQAVVIALLVVRVPSVGERRRAKGNGPLPWRRAMECLRDHSHGVVFTVILLGLWYVLFAWFFPVNDSPRYFLPVAPIVHCGMASGLVLGVRMVLSELPWPQGKTRAALVNMGYLALALLVILTTSNQVLVGLGTVKLQDPFRSDVEQNADAEVVLQWIESQESDETVRLLSGPSHTLPFWMYEESVVQQDIPANLLKWDELVAFVSENDLPWAVVDAQMVERRPDLLGEYFDFDGKDLVLKQTPPGWTLVREVHGTVYDWYVFRTSQE